MAVAEFDKSYLFRMSQADYVRWRADAYRQGKKLSEWMRECLNAGGGRIQPARAEPAVKERPTEPLREPGEPVAVGRLGTVQSSSFETERQRARELAQENGKCTADVTKGVRCRLCSKYH